MMHFDPNQRDIIDQIRKTGRCTNAQIAVLLPTLVNYIFKSDNDISQKLAVRYGADLSNILEGLGSELLDGSEEALNLFEIMISKTRKDN